MSESLGHRKKDWDFSSTLKTLLDRHTLELSNEELEEINLYLLNQREHAIALYSQQLYGMKRTANRLSKYHHILRLPVNPWEEKPTRQICLRFCISNHLQPEHIRRYV